jgi:hypothetical protein
MLAGVRSSPLAIAGGEADSAFLEDGSRQPLLEVRQRLAHIGFTGKRGAARFFEDSDFCVALLSQLFDHRTLRLRLSGLQVDKAPALLHTAISRSNS